jgi:hypothetical protein
VYDSATKDMYCKRGSVFAMLFRMVLEHAVLLGTLREFIEPIDAKEEGRLLRVWWFCTTTQIKKKLMVSPSTPFN